MVIVFFCETWVDVGNWTTVFSNLNVITLRFYMMFCSGVDEKSSPIRHKC